MNQNLQQGRFLLKWWCVRKCVPLLIKKKEFYSTRKLFFFFNKIKYKFDV